MDFVFTLYRLCVACAFNFSILIFELLMAVHCYIDFLFFFQSLSFQKINRIITAIDSQPMFDGGVLINVLGRLQVRKIVVSNNEYSVKSVQYDNIQLCTRALSHIMIKSDIKILYISKRM